MRWSMRLAVAVMRVGFKVMAWFFLISISLVAALGGLFWFWRQRVELEIAEGATIEWAHLQKHEPEFLDGISEEQFRAVYRRVHMPRFPGYALATFGAFVISLPLTLGFLSFLQLIGTKMGLLPEPLEIVRYVQLGEVEVTEAWKCNAECQLYVAEAFAGFYYFFGIVAVWLAIVAFFMRRYHSRRPGYLRDELIRSRDAS